MPLTLCPTLLSMLVQVRHPGVCTTMERDFTLMRRAAAIVAALPLVGSPSVKESVMQVGAGSAAGWGWVWRRLAAGPSWRVYQAVLHEQPAAAAAPSSAPARSLPVASVACSLAPRCASSWTW